MKPLSIDQIEEARSKILLNATELIEEAELLLRNGRFTRAYSLAHLACEEMARIPMLVRAAMDKTRKRPVDWKRLDRRLRSHTEKITGILHTDYLMDPHTKNDEDIKRLNESLAKVEDFNMLKNQSLYTTLVGDSFLRPFETIPPDLATNLVELARNRLRFFQAVELPTQGRLEQMAKSSEFQSLLSLMDELLKARKDSNNQ